MIIKERIAKKRVLNVVIEKSSLMNHDSRNLSPPPFTINYWGFLIAFFPVRCIFLYFVFNSKWKSGSVAFTYFGFLSNIMSSLNPHRKCQHPGIDCSASVWNSSKLGQDTWIHSPLILFFSSGFWSIFRLDSPLARYSFDPFAATSQRCPFNIC